MASLWLRDDADNAPDEDAASWWRAAEAGPMWLAGLEFLARRTLGARQKTVKTSSFQRIQKNNHRV
jgi:hypothetical protein